MTTIVIDLLIMMMPAFHRCGRRRCSRRRRGLNRKRLRNGRRRDVRCIWISRMILSVSDRNLLRAAGQRHRQRDGEEELAHFKSQLLENGSAARIVLRRRNNRRKPASVNDFDSYVVSEQKRSSNVCPQPGGDRPP